MIPLIASIEQGVRSFFVERRGGARRRVACEVRLPACVCVPNEQLDPEAGPYPEPLMGHTRDVSRTGLSIVLPSARLGGRDITQEGARLRVVLSTPGRLLILHARTVRRERLTGEHGGESVLVGARIERLAERDRAHFESFLDGQKSRQP